MKKVNLQTWALASLFLTAFSAQAAISDSEVMLIADQFVAENFQSNYLKIDNFHQMVGPQGQPAVGLHYSDPNSGQISCSVSVMVDKTNGNIIPVAYWGVSHTEYKTSSRIECSNADGGDYGGGT